MACCRACRAQGASKANVWNWCGSPGGCTYTDGEREVYLKAGQCELRYNLGTSTAMGKAVVAGVLFLPGLPINGGHL